MTIELRHLPMREAADFWKDKVPMSAEEFADLRDEARARAFAVSGMAKGDQLSTVYDLLQEALDEGKTFGRFKEELDARFAARGWAQASPYRLDNIFRTNIQTAYGAGRYKQMMTAVKTRPFWMYGPVNDKRTRPTHLSLRNKVFPADHAFWDTWYPPNGFKCRCGVTSLSKRQIEARGLAVENDIPDMVEPVDPVTGEKLPAIPLLPDQGFGGNPARSYWSGMPALLTEKVEQSWVPEIAGSVLAEVAGGPAFERWYKEPAGHFPVGMLQVRHSEMIRARTRTARLSADTARKQRQRHPDIAPADYGRIQEIFDSVTPVKDGERSLIYVREDPGFVTVVKSTVTGRAVYVTSYRRLSREAAKKDREIRRLRAKEDK